MMRKFYLALAFIALFVSSAMGAYSGSYSTLENWRLEDENKPSVVLRLNNGKSITINFEHQEAVLVIHDRQEIIPEETRFTVPEGYAALCDFYHTKLVSGKAIRTDDGEGTILTQYEAGSVVEYIHSSWLMMVKAEDAASGSFRASDINGEYIGEDEEEEEVDLSEYVDSSGSRKYSEGVTRSTDPEEIVRTYGLSQERTASILRKHMDAKRLISNRERVKVYSQMFEEYEGDYLAAYYAALANFEMNRGSQAISWCDKALSVNHLYLPAKQLRKRATGITKKVR